MERWRKLHGRCSDHKERFRKKTAREGHKESENAQELTGLRAKLYQKRRHEKIQLEKQINKSGMLNHPHLTSHLAYLSHSISSIDRTPTNAPYQKNKLNEKAAKFSVPLPKFRGIAEEEIFRVVKKGKKTAKKGWKRMITKFVGPDFTKRPVKYERFIWAMGLQYKKADVTHPELGVTAQLPIISFKKNPQNPIVYTMRSFDEGNDH